MRKLFGFVVAAMVLFAAPVFAASTDNVTFAAKQIKWARYTNPTGNLWVITKADTAFIQDETGADTTEVINPDDIAWDVWPWSTTQSACGRIMVEASVSSVTGVDSLYWTTQIQTAEGSWQTIGYTMPAGTTAGAYNSMLATGGGGTGKQFTGPIGCDTDAVLAAAATNQLWMIGRPFRIIVYGDVSATTPQLSGSKLYLILPRREVRN